MVALTRAPGSLSSDSDASALPAKYEVVSTHALALRPLTVARGAAILGSSTLRHYDDITTYECADRRSRRHPPLRSWRQLL